MATRAEAFEHTVEKYVTMLEQAINIEQPTHAEYQDALGQAVDILQVMIDASKESESGGDR